MNTETESTAISIREEESLGQSTLAVIARAAQDKNVDVDKMERLLAMQREVLADQAREAANRDLFAFQEECPQLHKGSAVVVRGELRSRYTSYEDMMKQVRPLMKKHGFAERFNTLTNENGRISAVVCTIVHRLGHSWDSTFPVLPDGSGSKNEIQAIGSALSYGKRYSFQAAMGIVTTDEDDDGQSARRNEVPEMSAPGNPNRSRTVEAEAELLPPEGGREELIEAISIMISSEGVAESAINAAVSNLTNGSITDFRKLPHDKLAILATDEGFKKTVARARKLKGGA